MASPPPPNFRLHNASLTWGGGTTCEPIPPSTTHPLFRLMNVGLLFLIYSFLSLFFYLHRLIMTLKWRLVFQALMSLFLFNSCGCVPIFLCCNWWNFFFCFSPAKEAIPEVVCCKFTLVYAHVNRCWFKLIFDIKNLIFIIFAETSTKVRAQGKGEGKCLLL